MAATKLSANNDEEEVAHQLSQTESGSPILMRSSSTNGLTGVKAIYGPAATGKDFLVNDMLKTGNAEIDACPKQPKKKGALAGVFVPTCENMWGVLIFLRFYYIVGQAGIFQTLIAVTLSFAAACCTTSAMSSIASSGGLVSRGGPYYMISRALGPVVGATVGVMYWLAITMLAVLECLGAVEALCMAAPHLEFPGHKQALGSAVMASLALMVWAGINVVTKLGLFFAFIVVFTLFSYYFGLLSIGFKLDSLGPEAHWITGLSYETFRDNWGPHYDSKTNFGVVLSLFYPCFTGILSGANRADVLQDPPKDIRRGTFAAIIFSYFLYVSFFILWGSVADHCYLRGDCNGPSHEAGREIVNTIVWNPFPNSAFIGIIIASLSQSLQCLIVAPRLLQKIAQDRLLNVLEPLEVLSSRGEPARALLFTYLIAACLVLIGDLELVAPLLTMCFLVAYAFMNCSCFALTWLKSPTWRPSWIDRKRWRVVNMIHCGAGTVICLAIMIIVNAWWALASCIIAICLYLYIHWRGEARKWGSAMDGIKFRVAIRSLMQLEESQYQHVNWRPQVLVLYRIRRSQSDEINRHDILRFSSQLRKGRGFCVVACVLESDERDQQSMSQARAERAIIKQIMKDEGIEGFAEVVVAPSWAEGTDYIIQLTGIGGLVPNTVMLDWPEDVEAQSPRSAQDFVKILSHANSADKAVIAVKGSRDIPVEILEGTIDVWWMIHDGGFLILLSWLLMRHRTWRKCRIRVFTIAENVTDEQAKGAGEVLARTLRQKKLFDAHVEVIIVDDIMIQPFTYDWTLRVEDRHAYLKLLQKDKGGNPSRLEKIPCAIDDLFRMESDDKPARPSSPPTSSVPPVTSIGSVSSVRSAQMRDHSGVVVSDFRHDGSDGTPVVIRQHCLQPSRPKNPIIQASPAVLQSITDESSPLRGSSSQACASSEPPMPTLTSMINHQSRPSADIESCMKLNQVIHSRSSDAQLVVMNLPDPWGCDEVAASDFVKYCNTLTMGLGRVLFVHSSGHEVFDILE